MSLLRHVKAHVVDSIDNIFTNNDHPLSKITSSEGSLRSNLRRHSNLPIPIYHRSQSTDHDGIDFPTVGFEPWDESGITNDRTLVEAITSQLSLALFAKYRLHFGTHHTLLLSNSSDLVFASKKLP